MLTKKLSAVAACLAIVGTAGCEAPPDYGYAPGYTTGLPPSSGVVGGATVGDPLFSTTLNEYTTGQHVTLSLNNTTRGVMDYNLCRSTIEGAVNGVRRSIPVAQSCTAEVRRLLPGQSTTFSFQFPPSLHGGFQVRTIVNGRVLDTNVFDVRVIRDRD